MRLRECLAGAAARGIIEALSPGLGVASERAREAEIQQRSFEQCKVKAVNAARDRFVDLEQNNS